MYRKIRNNFCAQYHETILCSLVYKYKYISIGSLEGTVSCRNSVILPLISKLASLYVKIACSARRKSPSTSFVPGCTRNVPFNGKKKRYQFKILLLGPILHQVDLYYLQHQVQKIEIQSLFSTHHIFSSVQAK